MKLKNVLEFKKVLLTKEILGFIAEPNLQKIAKNNSKHVDVYRIIYKSGKKKIAGFIIEPKNKGNKKLPVIVYNRGGTREFGVIKIGFLYIRLALFARAGYVVFASQYSGNGGSEGVDEMGGEDRKDVLNLYPVIKSHPNCDVSRIGMFGWSRGAMMNYLAMREATWMKAVVSVSGENDQVEAVKFRKDWAEFQKEIYGGGKADSMDRSVLYWVDKLKSKAPVLLMHGGKDRRTNPLSTLKLTQKFQESGREFELIFKSEEDHDFSGSGEYFVWETAIEWFDRFLKNDGA